MTNKPSQNIDLQEVVIGCIVESQGLDGATGIDGDTQLAKLSVDSADALHIAFLARQKIGTELKSVDIFGDAKTVSDVVDNIRTQLQS